MRTKSNILIIAFLVVTSQLIYAGSATWSLNPPGSDWNSKLNWTPNTVPNGSADIASFGLSNGTAVSSRGDIEIASVVFNAGASAFNITTKGQHGGSADLSISGTGVTNNSEVSQNFIVESAGAILFRNTATAGNGTTFTLNGGMQFSESSTAGTASFVANGATGPDIGGGGISFIGNSTAAHATFTLNGATVNYAYGGAIGFFGSSSAGNGIFVLNSPSRSGPYASTIVFDQSATAGNGVFTLNVGPGEWPVITFNGSATAGNGTFNINGGQGSNRYGANVYFYGYSFSGDVPTAGNATFVINGGDGPGTKGGHADFSNESTAAQARLIANGGTNGGSGGYIAFFSNSEGGESRIELFGNGYLDVSFRLVLDVTIGSLVGDGFVYLGSHNLTVGSNDLSTAFSGIIQEEGGIQNGTGGSLTKIGTGTLTLSGGSTYTGGTMVTEGILRVRNTVGSATGTAAVNVNGGTLGGNGIIAGTVTVGTGSGPGATLRPGVGARKPTVLTIQEAVTFKADGTYRYKLNTKREKGDQLGANGVTIESGAQFDFHAVAKGKLTNGTVFTPISNTASTSINGNFTNLPDGGTITVGSNTFQASYEGGDGNDLTLTVVP